MTKPHRIRNQPWRLSSTRKWLLSIGLLLLDPALAQPTFDECKIFLVASDTARDLSLNKEPEYVRFLNLVARTYLLQDDFTTFDGLPLQLQTTYQAYAWTDAQEIDISAAAFGAQTGEDGITVLRAFCQETAHLIAGLLPTLPPTWAPTVEQTPQPSFPGEVSFDQEATLLTGPSDELSELPIECRRGMFGSDSDKDGLLNRDEYTLFLHQLLPHDASFVYSMDFDKLPQELQDNYDRLMEDDGHLHIYGAVPSQWAEASSQQRSFLQLICYRTEDAIQAVTQAQQQAEQTATPTLGAQVGNGGALGSIKTTPPITMPPLGGGVAAGQNQTGVIPMPPANPDNNQNNNQNTTPPAASSNTGATTATTPPAVPATPTTNIPATTIAGSGSSESSGTGNGNVVGAVVGSLLIVLLGGAMAKDKHNRIPKYFQKCWRKRISPFAGQGDSKKKPHTDSTSEVLPPTDFDSSYNEQTTGFLEDHRVAGTTNLGGITNLDQDEESQMPPPQPQRKSSTPYGVFQTVRFNPDEFNAPPPQYAQKGNTMRFNPDDFIEPQQPEESDDDDEQQPNKKMDDHLSERFVVNKLSSFEERMINDDFHDYQYDTTTHEEDDDSSAMSLYCSSVPGDEEMPTAPVQEKKKKPKKKGPRRSLSTHETDLLTEFSSPRRNSKTMYHANRFGKIAQSESRNNNASFSTIGSSGGKSVRRKKKPKPNWRELQRSPQPDNKPSPLVTNKPPLPPRPKPQAKPPEVEPKTPKAANKKKIKKKPTRKGAPPPPQAVGSSARKKKKAAPAKAEPIPESQLEAEVDRFLQEYAMDDLSDTSDHPSRSGFHHNREQDEASQENHSRTGFFLEDDDDDDEPDKSSFQSPTTQEASSSFSFVYGGKSYSIDAADVSPKPVPKTTSSNSQARRMHFTEITLGSQDDDDSASEESTSFLSDDFTDPGDEVLSSKKKKPKVPPPPRPNAMARRPNQTQRALTPRTKTAADDKGDKKPRPTTTDRDSLSLDESITDSVGSCGSSFLRDSSSSANKSFSHDSTYNEEPTESFTFPPESSSSSSYASVQTLEGDPIPEIHRLVAIVMPSERDKVTRMLAQYQGREGELLKTLQRLEVRLKARQSISSSRPVPAPAKKNDRAARMRTIRQQAEERRRQQKTSENAAQDLDPVEAKRMFSERSQRLLDLDMSSSDEGEDDFSQDSTYFENEEDQHTSCTSFRDDDSLSHYSELI